MREPVSSWSSSPQVIGWWVELSPGGALGAMGEAHGGPLRVRGQQPVRAIIFAALVPWIGGMRCLRLRLARRDRVGQLPLSDDREGLAEAAT